MEVRVATSQADEPHAATLPKFGKELFFVECDERITLSGAKLLASARLYIDAVGSTRENLVVDLVRRHCDSAVRETICGDRGLVSRESLETPVAGKVFIENIWSIDLSGPAGEELSGFLRLITNPESRDGVLVLEVPAGARLRQQPNGLNLRPIDSRDLFVRLLNS